MYKKLFTVALLFLLGQALWAQEQSNEYSTNAGDTIEERANRALLADRMKAIPPPAAAPSAPSGDSTKGKFGFEVKAPREYSLVALRGWSDSLEATLVINGKRVTGSMKYPTLTEDWRLETITQKGVVISKGKERRELAFVGPEPYTIAKPAVMSAAVGQSPLPPGMLATMPTMPSIAR